MVVDSSGKVLSKAQDESRFSRLSHSQIEYQRNIEKDITGRVQSMLEKVVGEGKAVVRVTADLDFRVTEKTEEKYDPEEPVIRSVQRLSEKDEPLHKADEVINYEINRIVNKTLMPVGDIKKLSIAVLVDGDYIKSDKGIEEFQPRSKKDLAALEELVKKAVGFDVKREDQVIVSSVPFKKVDDDSEATDGGSWKDTMITWFPLMKQFTIFAGVICLVLFVIRPMVKMLVVKGMETPIERRIDVVEGGADALNAMPATLALVDNSSRAMTEADVVKQMAGADAQRFAELLRNWLK
jgi:flagellar M-ring protein FliF